MPKLARGSERGTGCANETLRPAALRWRGQTRSARLIAMSFPRPFCLLPLCAALLWMPLAARAASARYHYDPVHSQVLFSIDHDGFSRPFGRLHIAKGWLQFDPKDFSTAATELDIDLAGVDMGDADWNEAVCKPALLDCAKYRYAHFVSTGVERKDDEHGVLHGQLTMRGMTQPMDIAFTFNRLATTIYGMHTVAGFSATASLQRESFGITAFDHSIGHDVAIWMALEAIRGDEPKPSTKDTP
jgi:polyisoprenoid-binding protein YceI